MILIKIFIIFFLSIRLIYAEIPNLENRDKEKIKDNIVDTYLRSMNKWDIPFQDLLENRSGSACINWDTLTEEFLKTGMFDALGYSQNIPNKKASQIAALSGCKKMKEYYKLGETCKCEIILSNNLTEIKLPIKKFDLEKEFINAVSLYKKKNFEKAYDKFEKLSEMGDSKSQYNLAIIFYKGLGVPQNFKLAYFWSMMSKLHGQKEGKKIINKSLKRISKPNKDEIETEIKESLENSINEGKIFAVIPLARWYLTVPKKPDYNNSYLWLSVASALDIKNSRKARDSIFRNVNKKNLGELQKESNEIYANILALKKSNKME